MSNETFAYPFDPTGSKSANLVTQEYHTVTPPDWDTHYFIVPKVGPFFKNNLKVVHLDSGAELVEGIDFVLGYQFIGASSATTMPVYGAISIYNRDLAGVLSIEYQTLGGTWTIDEEKAAELLLNASTNPRITTWEQVIELPYAFPPIDHEWDLVDMVGASELEDALDRITEAIEFNTDEGGSSGGGGNASHLLDMDNPHNVTKIQVGLGNVPNWQAASLIEAREGERGDAFMSPELVCEAIKTFALEPLNDHINNTDNPHSVTKSQVNLGNVDNFKTATTTEAIDGESSELFITPSGAKAAIEAQMLNSPLGAHATDTENPHSVTKAQVGLGSVENYAIASSTQMKTDLVSDKYVTPILVYEAIAFHTSGLVKQVDMDEFVTILTASFDDATDTISTV